ncbi:DUF6234 family protein [Kitasatospora sp. NBC_00070]|uniref:DUF6234 family protein n=1 Tax=Kitasatospora sp. NBC_00070 TaxID=2975962 RepID=UPI00324485F2
MPAATRPRPDLATDLVSAFLFLLLSAVGGWFAFVSLAFRHWGDQDTGPEPYDWTPILTVGALALWLLAVTALAWRRRLRVTAVLHGLLLTAVLLTGGANHAYQHRHDNDPRPEPLPSNHQPCFSGSGRCN